MGEQESFFNVRIKTLRQQINEAEEDMKSVFTEFDTDGGGSICNVELQNALKSMGQELTMDEVDKLIEEIDVNGDGEVDFEEFKVMVGQSWFINAFQSKLVESMEVMMQNMNIDDDDDIDGDGVDDEKNNNQELMEEITEKEQKIITLQNEMEENERKQTEEIDKLQNEIKNLKNK